MDYEIDVVDSELFVERANPNEFKNTIHKQSKESNRVSNINDKNVIKKFIKKNVETMEHDVELHGFSKSYSIEAYKEKTTPEEWDILLKIYKTASEFNKAGLKDDITTYHKKRKEIANIFGISNLESMNHVGVMMSPEDELDECMCVAIGVNKTDFSILNNMKDVILVHFSNTPNLSLLKPSISSKHWCGDSRSYFYRDSVIYLWAVKKEGFSEEVFVKWYNRAVDHYGSTAYIYTPQSSSEKFYIDDFELQTDTKNNQTGINAVIKITNKPIRVKKTSFEELKSLLTNKDDLMKFKLTSNVEYNLYGDSYANSTSSSASGSSASSNYKRRSTSDGSEQDVSFNNTGKSLLESSILMNNDEFFEETYKPFDEYLKMHDFDPKTSTVDTGGDRSPIGLPKSKKEHNRINKFLRENDFDPKTGTIATDIIDPKTGKNKRIEFNFTQDFFGTPEYGSDDKRPTGPYQYMGTVAMPVSSLTTKPSTSNYVFKHEEGHVDDYLHKNVDNAHKSEIDKIKDISKTYEDTNDEQGLMKGIHRYDHDRLDNEHYADYYGNKHNPYGSDTRNITQSLNKLENDGVRKLNKEIMRNKIGKGQYEINDKFLSLFKNDTDVDAFCKEQGLSQEDADQIKEMLKIKKHINNRERILKNNKLKKRVKIRSDIEALQKEIDNVKEQMEKTPMWTDKPVVDPFGPLTDLYSDEYLKLDNEVKELKHQVANLTDKYSENDDKYLKEYERRVKVLQNKINELGKNIDTDKKRNILLKEKSEEIKKAKNNNKEMINDSNKGTENRKDFVDYVKTYHKESVVLMSNDEFFMEASKNPAVKDRHREVKNLRSVGVNRAHELGNEHKKKKLEDEDFFLDEDYAKYLGNRSRAAIRDNFKTDAAFQKAKEKQDKRRIQIAKEIDDYEDASDIHGKSMNTKGYDNEKINASLWSTPFKDDQYDASVNGIFIQPDTLKSKHFKQTIEHEKAHAVQRKLNFNWNKSDENYHKISDKDDYVVKCAKLYAEKFKDKLNDHDYDYSELHADVMAARKIGYNKMYKQIMKFKANFESHAQEIKKALKEYEEFTKEQDQLIEKNFSNIKTEKELKQIHSELEKNEKAISDLHKKLRLLNVYIPDDNDDNKSSKIESTKIKILNKITDLEKECDKISNGNDISMIKTIFKDFEELENHIKELQKSLVTYSTTYDTRGQFIIDMKHIHEGHPNRCSMKYPPMTPEEKKFMMESATETSLTKLLNMGIITESEYEAFMLRASLINE